MAALRTISLRLRGTSTKELEEAGEDTTGVVESKSKLRTKIQGYTGVDILTDTGAYKSTYEILLEISKVWDDLTDTDQAGLLEIIAGKTRSNTAAAILSNTKDLKDALLAAQEAEGSALRENEKYLDSIQGKMDQFNNAIQTMWSNTLDDDMVKGVVELGTELVKIVDNFGLIKTLVMAIGTFLIQKNFKGDLFGGLFSTQNIEEVRVKLQSLKTEYEKAQQAYDTNHTNANKRYLDNTKKTYEKYNAKISPQLEEYDKLINKRQALTNELSDAQLHEEFQTKRLAAGYDNAASSVDNARNNVARIKGEITQTDNAIKNVEKQLQQSGVAGATAGQKIKAGFKSAKAEVLKFGKQMLQSMAYMYIITTTIELIGTGISWLIKKISNAGDSFESLQEKFDEAKSAVDAVKSEIKNLESELETTDERIEELLELGTLTFVEQEELNRLKSVSDELRAQISLKQQLQGSLQKGANDATIVAANKYMDTSFANEKTRTEVEDKGAETGEFIGKLAGIGIAIAALAAAIPSGGASLLAIPVALGSGAIGGAIGSGVAGANYDAEESVGEAIANMKTQREELIKARDEALAAYADGSGSEEVFNSAEQKLTEFNANMAKSITQIAEYRNSIMSDVANATPAQLEQAKAWGDIIDAYNIDMGGANAKANAIARIFGDEATGNIAQARDEINKLKDDLAKAKKSGKGVDEALAALQNYKLNLSEEEVARLRDMGIYLYEVEDYFKDVVDAESEFVSSDLEDVAKDISKITDGLDSLKSAFDEVIEEGNLTAKTILSIKEALGIGVDDTKELTAAWTEYLQVMMSGAATTEEMVDATEQLAQAWIEDALANNSLTPENRMEFVGQLRSLGVENAEEYVNDLLQKNMVKELEDTINIGTIDNSDIAEEYYKRNGRNSSTVREYRSFSQARKDRLAEEYGLVAEINDEIKDDIIERYGVESDAVDAIIEKLREKEGIEKQIANVQKNKDAYNTWRNADGGFMAVKQDYEKLKKEYDSFSDEVKNFVYSDWRTVTGGYQNIETKEKLTGNELAQRREAYNAYLQWMKDNSAEYSSLQQQYNTLWQEGVNRGYIVYGKVVDPKFEEKINSLNEQLENISTEIDKELTVNIELKLQLQNFDDGVDKIQDAYSTLKDIATEYNTQGYLSLDNLQALLNLSPEYLAVLQMENGQITINQSALQSMLETKLDDAEATAVQTAITQLNALAERKKAIEVSNSAVAANQASIELGTYSGALSTVAQDAIVAAGSVAAFNAALKGAQDNEFVSDEEWQQILTNYENTVGLIGSVRENLSSNFNNVLDPGSQTAQEETEDTWLDQKMEEFQKEMDYWENRIGANQARYEQLQNEIDLLEKKGQKAYTSFYDEQIELEREREELLIGQKAAAADYLKQLEDAGLEGSEEWWEIANTLNDIEGELDDVTASIVDLQDAIAEIDTYKFEEFNTRLDNLINKLETIRNLLAPDSEEDWFDDEGNWTEEGVAVLGSYLQELEMYKQGYADTVDELNKYTASYEGNEAYYEELGIHSEQEYYDKTEELISQQYDFAESISDTEQSVVDMYESSIDAIEEYTETLVDSYNDYIDSVKEALDAERDLYDFKKNVQKQAKDIAEIERRIASLSGSTNKADIAERRKLEAQLYESRESLNDTYYDHAKESQQNALDAEAEAYEENMTKFVEGLRMSLETATIYMDEFLMGVTSMVMYNADTVLTKYQETNLPLTAELTNPWEKAKDATNSYSGNALALMSEWTKQGGFFAQFNANGTTNLTSPWGAGTTAATNFKADVGNVMSGVVTNIASNVKSASGELSSLYNQIQDTERRAASANVSIGSGATTSSSNDSAAPIKKYYVTKTLSIGGQNLSVTKSDINASRAMTLANEAILGAYEDYQKRKGVSEISYETAWQRTWRGRVNTTTNYYAKGTTGTSHDEWAITDEPRFGDELVLVPGKDGNLSFMRKGTGVVPADLTANLMEWGQFTPDAMNLGGGVNVNMINNAVNKPEFNFAFDALVKAENITEETLPAVKKLVTQELNRFTKELNYALKGKGAR